MKSITLLLSLFLITHVAAVDHAINLLVSGPDTVTSVDELSLTATVLNTGAKSIKLFNDPRTVLSTFNANTFRITTSTGCKPKFIGATAKYNFKTALALGQESDFTTLAPGASAAFVHDLSTTYNFTACGTGTYIFTAFSKFHFVDDDGTVVTIIPALNQPHTLELTGGLVPTKRDLKRRAAVPVLGRRANHYAGCNDTEQALIEEAVPAAVGFADSAVKYLSGLSATSTQYSTWFGGYSEIAKGVALAHYESIGNNSITLYTFDCTLPPDGCTETTFAFVYPDQWGYVYLCGAFWKSATIGQDSKAGTIIHESSHFTANGGTEDLAYGPESAAALAKTNPVQALMNADNHEYFVETLASATS